MDISLNLIDLQYLTNPNQLTKIRNKKEFYLIQPDDLEFYKKRILQTTKDMLRGEKDNGLNKAFIEYAKTCIEHFKFTDKIELIQEEYKNLKTPVPKSRSFDMKTGNTMMLRKKNIHPKITDNIKIKSTRIIKPIIMPKKKNFNLKDPKFREKGLKKKNINNI